MTDARSKWFSITSCTAVCVVVGLVAIALVPANAARDPIGAGSVQRTEIVVYEDPTSEVCQLFRARIAAGYRASPRGRVAPMRFVDITTTTATTEGPGLMGPITVVPTAVVMRGGHEVGRVVGYWGPAAFTQMIGSALRDDE